MRNWGSRMKKHKINSQTVPDKKDKRRDLSHREWPGLFFAKKIAPIFMIILAFLFNIMIPQDLAWAKSTDTMPSPIGEDQSVGPGQPSILGPNDINIPAQFGSVKERFQQDRDPKGLIVHIQDLHTHYQAHKNIANIIEYLARKHNINVVLCEAKMTDRGFAYLRPWSYDQMRKDVAEEDLKEGILTGWEVLDLASDLDLVLQGIEDKELYMKNMESFIKAEIYREDALKFLDLVGSIVNNLKLHMYSAAQKNFDEKMCSYRAETIGIASYAKHLGELAVKYKVDYSGFVNLGILSKTLELEAIIDFKKAERERERIITALGNVLKDGEIKVLFDMSMKFKANRISQYEFYNYLAAISKKAGIDFSEYPNFDLYTKYISTYHMLDASRLFTEINDLEDLLSEAIFAKEDQKKLFLISKNLIILKGLVDFKLTPDEFDYYDKTKISFSINEWLDFLRSNSEYFKLAQRVPDDASIIKDNLSVFEGFYRVARERDQAFVENTKEQFAKRDLAAAILTTGGFHTPGVMRRLKEAGYSYVVISPRMEGEMDYDKYHKILKESYRMLKEIAVLGPASAAEVRAAIIVGQLLASGAFRFPRSPDEARLLSINHRIALVLADGTRVIRPGALEGRPDLMLQVLLGPGSFKAGEILESLERAEAEGERPEGLPAYDEARRSLHAEVGDKTSVEVHEGIVAAFVVTPTGEVMVETEELAAPGEGFDVTDRVEPRPAEPMTAQSIDVIGDRTTSEAQVEDILKFSEVDRRRADEDRSFAIAAIEEAGKNAGMRLNADAIVGTSDPEEAKLYLREHMEEVREYLTFIAANIYEWRKAAPDMVFFDFEGTDAIIDMFINDETGIWTNLGIVQNNKNLMRLEREITRQEKRFRDTLTASVRWTKSDMSLINPTFYLEEVPVEGGMRWFPWDSAMLGALLMSPASDLAARVAAESGKAGLTERIERDMGDENTVFGKFATVMARLCKIDRRAITAEMMIFVVYDYAEYKDKPQLYVARLLNKAYWNGWTVIIREIRRVDFDAIRELFKMLREVVTSI